jgi:RND family efflux transporter MFP subunit
MKNRLTGSITFIAAMLTFVACGEKEVTQKDTVKPVKAIQVGDEQAFGGRWFPGQAEAAEEANLSFRVSGTLQEFPVKLGEEVRKGALLARLDPHDYQVALNDAEANLRKAQAGLDLAESEFARVDRIWQKDPGAVSKSMVDVRKAELDTARAQVVSAQAAVDNARDKLSYTSLRAPYSGTVGEKFVENFEDVQAKQQIVRVLDTRNIEFRVQIPETLMTHTDKVHQAGAFVVFDAFPGIEVPARIKEIGKEASRTTRTYPVTLIMKQPKDFKVLPGMAGKARGNREAARRIARETGMEGVEIPMSATFAGEGGKTYVWVIDPQTKKVSRREVNVVNLTEKGAMVSGLEPGEWIATAGVNILVQDQQVRILQ